MSDASQGITITQPSGGGAPRDRPALTLRVLYAEPHGVALSPGKVLDEGTLVLGRASRDPELAALAADPSVSRSHATLLVATDPPAIEVADGGSRNGTFVNGARVSRCRLADGDVIRLGSSILLYRLQPPGIEDAVIEAIAGRSPAIRRVRGLIKRVAPTDATVLLLGESGVGKGLAARALDDLSGREGPFVSVNSSAIPDGLAESQLFGHVAGAFTGAHRDHPGFFRAAHGGTLFLDEIGELPLPIQAKLLSVVEEGAVTPLGSARPLTCDVRLITATNVDLADAVARKAFRGDLYARLSELTLSLPPLRERREDVLGLLVAALGEPPPPLAPDLAEALLLYAWPYNVREVLKVATELKVLGAGKPRLELALVAHRLRTAAPMPAPAARDEAPEERTPIPSRDELVRLLREKAGVISEIASAAGRSRKQIYRWLEQYGLDADQYRAK